MSSILEEIDSYFGCGSMSDEEYLEHYGMPRRSGRYPWGSGKEPFQSSRDFLGRVEQMRKNGFTYTDRLERNILAIMLLQSLLDILLLISELCTLSPRMSVVDMTWQEHKL